MLGFFCVLGCSYIEEKYSCGQWTPLPLECQPLPSINRKYDQFPPALPQTHSPMAAKSIPNIMKFNKILFPLSHLSYLGQPPVMLNS